MLKLLYITFPGEAEAAKLASQLLAEKLIACANILGGGFSIYRWEGETKQEKEFILIAKTTDKQAQKAIERVRDLHSYTTPCILLLPVEGGNKEFIEWVSGEVPACYPERSEGS